MTDAVEKRPVAVETNKAVITIQDVAPSVVPSINEVEDAAVNINEPDAPKQKKFEKEITSLQADIINLQRKRDSNMMTGNDRKELQEKKELLKVTEKSL